MKTTRVLFLIALFSLLASESAGAQCLGTNCQPRLGTQAAPRHVAPSLPSPPSQSAQLCDFHCQLVQENQQQHQMLDDVAQSRQSRQSQPYTPPGGWAPRGTLQRFFQELARD